MGRGKPFCSLELPGVGVLHDGREWGLVNAGAQPNNMLFFEIANFGCVASLRWCELGTGNPVVKFTHRRLQFTQNLNAKFVKSFPGGSYVMC